MITLKTNEQLVIREATPADAPKIITYVKKMSGETASISFEPSEFKLTVAEEEKVLENHRTAKNQIYLMAEIGQELVGILNVQSSYKKRLRHVGEFGVSVLKEHWNKGVGYHLLQHMIQWAKDTKLIRKINLQVQVTNAAAIHLYEKLGFKKEGVSTRGNYINGQFLDIYCMGLEID